MKPHRHRGRPEHRSRQRAVGTGVRDARRLLHVATLPAVLAVFETAPGRIEQLFFEDRLKGELGPLCIALAKAHRPYRIVDGRELERHAGTAMHGGVVALVEPRPLPLLDTADAADWARDGRLLPVLDGVGNPHNLGAIARTAAFFGLPRLVLSGHPGQALPSDASYRVARGGLDHLGLFRASRLPEALCRLGRHYQVVGTALEQGKPLDDLKRSTRPVVLVLGNEEDGLPPETLDACDAVVTIPGGGPVQSLNVAATAAILIHALDGKRPGVPS